MSMGMPYDVFWHGDPWMAKIYREADLLTVEKRNHEAWLHGFYVYEAVAVALSNAMRKKGARTEKYPEPVRITPLSEAEKAEKIRKERQRAVDYFTSFEKRFNKKEAAK